LASLGHPSKFQLVSCLSFVTAPTSLNGCQQNFAGCLAVFWAGTLYIHFWGLLPLKEFPAGKFTLHPSLAFCYIGSVTAWHSSSGRQPNFVAWYKEWNYGTFTEGATYIRLGGHQSTLGIGPHSSLIYIMLLLLLLLLLHRYIHTNLYSAKIVKRI